MQVSGLKDRNDVEGEVKELLSMMGSEATHTGMESGEEERRKWGDFKEEGFDPSLPLHGSEKGTLFPSVMSFVSHSVNSQKLCPVSSPKIQPRCTL